MGPPRTSAPCQAHDDFAKFADRDRAHDVLPALAPTMWGIPIPLFVLPLDIFSRVILHHRRGDQGQDRADENVDSDRIGGVIFTNSQVAIKPLGDLCESGCGT